ncbi:serine hydroxymethyltransferase [Euzebya sp.]|uniref:serine hydroxymethyltransferase n=1 Tax=Euzebya sp. TaxID=1971409 RepID=UPI0035118FCB
MHRTAAAARPWLSPTAQAREAEILAGLPTGSDAIATAVDELAAESDRIHVEECVNLNPATNVMNPAAEALLSSRLGTRPSLGHPGEKYETGLEAIEQIEVIAAHLACEVMGTTYAEVRVPSGSIANLIAFMATCRPGDAIIVPPPAIGGHVTHDRAGAAGLYGLEIHHAPIDAARYTIDVDGLADLAERVRPALITVGGSLNLTPHPVEAISDVARATGARVLFDAAHACGMLAGQVWPNPLAQGADLITMSTYKSLGGPPAGLVLTDDADLAARIDAVTHPGLTANFDVANTAALAVALLDWVDHGTAYAQAMVDTARTLADALADAAVPVFTTTEGPTTTHQLAIHADRWGGGQATADHLRRANVLASGIGLPTGEGLRLGTPEVVRWGMGPDDMAELAGLIAEALDGDPTAVEARTTAFRSRFTQLHHIRG